MTRWEVRRDREAPGLWRWTAWGPSGEATGVAQSESDAQVRAITASRHLRGLWTEAAA